MDRVVGMGRTRLVLPLPFPRELYKYALFSIVIRFDSMPAWSVSLIVKYVAQLGGGGGAVVGEVRG